MFNLYDYDRSGSVTKDEMQLLLYTLGRASFCVGLLEAPPTHEDITTLTKSMFQKADDGTTLYKCRTLLLQLGSLFARTLSAPDNTGDVSMTEFLSWAREQVLSRQLLNDFNTVRRDATRKLQCKSGQPTTTS